jgi:tetratricopeptide (TPR) repeat protein
MKKHFIHFKPVVVCFFVLVLVLNFNTSAFGFFKSDYQEGLSAFEKKDYNKSFQFLQKVLKKDPKNVEAMQLLGFVYFQLNRIRDAEITFLEVQKLSKNNDRVFRGLGWIYFLYGKNEESKKYFLKEIEWANNHFNNSNYAPNYTDSDKAYIESTYSDGNYGLGLLAKRAGDYKTAISSLENAAKKRNEFSERSEILTALGDCHLEQSKYSDAASVYSRAVSENKKNLTAHLKLAWSYYYDKKYDMAEKAFEKAQDASKESVEALYGLALSGNMLGKPEKVRENLASGIALGPYYMDNRYVHEIIEKKPDLRSLWKDFGLAYYKYGYYAAAVYKLDGYLGKINPNDFDAMVAAGWSYRWLGYLDKAIDTFNDAARLNPKSDEPLVGLGSAYMAYGKAAESEDYFKKALSANQKSAIAHNGLAYLYNYLKDPVKAEDALKKSIAIKKDYFDSQAFLANLYLSQKRYAEAAKEYENVLKIDRSLPATLNGLGWSYYYSGRFKDARGAFEESKKLNPYFAEAHYGLGLSLSKLGEKEDSKSEFVTAIQIWPYYSHTKDLVDIIKSDKSWSDLYMTLGWSYYYNLQYALALDAFKEYQKEKPGDIPALRGIAWSNYWMGQLDTAYSNFQEILKKDTGDLDAMVGTGWVLFYKGRDEDALGILKKAVAKDPKLTNAMRTMAAIYFKNKNYREADSIYKKIAELEPHATDAHNNQGWLLYKEQKYKEAIGKFNESLGIYRYFGEPHYGIALSYLKTGEIDKAKESFTTAIYLYPGYMDGKELYEILDGNPKLKSLNVDLGWSYYYNYYYDAAKFHFNRALKADPSDRDAMLGAGTISYVLGDLKSAIEIFGKLTDGIPKTAEYWDKWSYMLDNLGWSYFYSKDYDKALETFKKLEAYHPKIKYIAPINGQAWCLLQTGKKAEAEKLFRESIKIVPGNYSAETGIRSLKK